jgi:hypothetical protein
MPAYFESIRRIFMIVLAAGFGLATLINYLMFKVPFISVFTVMPAIAMTMLSIGAITARPRYHKFLAVFVAAGFISIMFADTTVLRTARPDAGPATPVTAPHPDSAAAGSPR